MTGKEEAVTVEQMHRKENAALWAQSRRAMTGVIR